MGDDGRYTVGGVVLSKTEIEHAGLALPSTLSLTVPCIAMEASNNEACSVQLSKQSHR